MADTSRTLLALACFAVFAAVLAGGVVWASDDTAAPVYYVCQTIGWSTGNGKAVMEDIAATEDCPNYFHFNNGHCVIGGTGLDADTRREYEKNIEQVPGDPCPNGIEFRDG